MLPNIVPAEMLSTACAMAIRPRMAGEPRERQRRHAGFPAAQGLHKRNDFKLNSFRIRKSKFILTSELEPVPFIRHAIEAPATKPIARRITDQGFGAVFG